MVKIGFICEDDAGKRIVESENFNNLLSKFQLELVNPVRNAQGKGNLTKQNVTSLVLDLFSSGASHIFLLTDMDMDACITLTKQNIIQHPNCTLIVCKKAVEAWFLADSTCMSALLQQNIHFPEPEEPINPFQTINQLYKEKFNGRGIGKSTLSTRMIKNGFSISNASYHSNCKSASYFLQKLQFIASIKAQF